MLLFIKHASTYTHRGIRRETSRGYFHDIVTLKTHHYPGVACKASLTPTKHLHTQDEERKGASREYFHVVLHLASSFPCLPVMSLSRESSAVVNKHLHKLKAHMNKHRLLS